MNTVNKIDIKATFEFLKELIASNKSYQLVLAGFVISILTMLLPASWFGSTTLLGALSISKSSFIGSFFSIVIEGFVSTVAPLAVFLLNVTLYEAITTVFKLLALALIVSGYLKFSKIQSA